MGIDRRHFPVLLIVIGCMNLLSVYVFQVYWKKRQIERSYQS
uniref:Uncharacterized protein n=1 Tax=Rhizophora mucronata TaxID=61149 RepID=A0A2P2NKQ2_RHIMU